MMSFQTKGKALTVISLVACFLFLLPAFQPHAEAGWFGSKKIWKITAQNIEEIRAKAEKGDPYYQAILGEDYLTENSVMKKDYKEALKWFKLSAEQKHPIGLYRLASMYDSGLEVKKDKEKAGALYKKALPGMKKLARKGNPRAQTDLGVMYDYGYGVPEDDAEAVKWYRKAADQGYKEIKISASKKAAPASQPEQTYTKGNCFDGERKGFFIICDEKTAVDLRTNKMWMRHSSYSNNFPRYLSWPAAFEWKDKLNANSYGGYSDWNLPLMKDLELIYDPNNSSCTTTNEDYNFTTRRTTRKTLYHHIPPAFHCEFENWDRNKPTWSRDVWDKQLLGLSDRVKSFFFIDFAGLASRKKDELVVRLVRGNALEWVSSFKSKGETSTTMDDATLQTVNRALAAFKAGLKKPGAKLFSQAVASNALALYEGNYWKQIFNSKGPISLSSEILLAAYEQKKNTSGFWFDYGHNANLAGQPLLALRAADKLDALAGGESGNSNEAKDAAAVVRAIAFSQMDKMDDAYTALLDRSPLGENIGVIVYLNQWGQKLLRDKKKLAIITGIDESLLLGKETKVEAQTFYNVETGNLIDPNTLAAPPKLMASPKAKKKTNAPARKPVQKGKEPDVEILD